MRGSTSRLTRLVVACLALAGCASVLLAWPTSDPAHAVATSQNDGARKIRIGIYLVNLEQLTVNTGNYTAELFLTFSCDGPCNIDDYRIVDGKYTILDKDIRTQGDATRQTYHIRADLNENLDFSEFPFDHHALAIRVESADQNVSDLEFVADDDLAGLAPDLKLAGWAIEPQYESEVAPHSYKIYDQPFSRYTFRIFIERPQLFGWLKALLPATVIMISGLLAYLFSYESAGNSIAVVTAALAGSVLFNINLTSSLPATGHLTTADLFMIVNYIALVATLAIMITVYMLKERKQDDRARRLFSVARRVVPAIWILTQAAMLFYSLTLRSAA